MVYYHSAEIMQDSFLASIGINFTPTLGLKTSFAIYGNHMITIRVDNVFSTVKQALRHASFLTHFTSTL